MLARNSERLAQLEHELPHTRGNVCDVTDARAAGPRGVHVAYVVIDAVIDLEWIRKRWPERLDDFFIKPSAIAEEIWHIVHQDRSAWSFNVELRPL